MVFDNDPRTPVASGQLEGKSTAHGDRALFLVVRSLLRDQSRAAAHSTARFEPDYLCTILVADYKEYVFYEIFESSDLEAVCISVLTQHCLLS
jgi:hypothetical protein